MHRRAFGILTGAALLASGAVLADTYPSRVVTIVVPFGAGSGSDTVARILSQHLASRLGQSVVVENRAGATGAVAAAGVSRAAPDGYTLLLGTNSTHGSNSSLYKKINYDPIKDFEPVAYTGTFNQLLIVDPRLPIRSVKELLLYGRDNPGKLSYAGGNAGGIVMAETFARESGTPLVKVPYRSNPAGLTDVIAGRVSLMFADISSALGFVQAGTIRALAVTTKGRSELFPDLPTIDAEGVKGYDLASWTSLFAPVGTPKEIVERLNREVNAVLALPDVKARLLTLGVETNTMSPADLATFVRSEAAKWARLVREAGIEAE